MIFRWGLGPWIIRSNNLDFSQGWERLPVLFFGRQLFGGRWIRITDTCTSRSFAFGEARLPTSSQRAGPPEFRVPLNLLLRAVCLISEG